MRNVALAAVFLGTVAIGAVQVATLAAGVAPQWGGAVLAGAIATVLVAFMLLGVSRAGTHIGWLWLAFAYVFIVLAGGFFLALTLPAETAGTRLILGLPPRAAIIMYGIGLFPAFVIPLAYAVTFDRLTLSEADLERVRAMRDAGRMQRNAAPAGAAHGTRAAVDVAEGGDA
jgi:hypothetical protein